MCEEKGYGQRKMSAVKSVVPGFGPWCAGASAATVSRQEEKEVRTELDRGLEETGRSSL